MVLNRSYSYDWLIVSFHDYPLERDDDDDDDDEGHAYFHNIGNPRMGKTLQPCVESVAWSIELVFNALW